MRILITEANSAQAHQLKNKFTADEVILGDYHDLPQFMLKLGKMVQLPNPQSTSYAHQMLTFCLDNAINKLYVLDRQEVALLAQVTQLFKEYAIDIQLQTDEIH